MEGESGVSKVRKGEEKSNVGLSAWHVVDAKLGDGYEI